MQSWTLSGREAEALHAQEEDEAAANMEDEDEEEDPIKKIIQSRYCSLVLLAPFSVHTYRYRFGFFALYCFYYFLFSLVQIFLLLKACPKEQLCAHNLFFDLTVRHRYAMLQFLSTVNIYLQYQYVLFNDLPGNTETSSGSDPGRSGCGGWGVMFLHWHCSFIKQWNEFMRKTGIKRRLRYP